MLRHEKTSCEAADGKKHFIDREVRMDLANNPGIHLHQGFLKWKVAQVPISEYQAVHPPPKDLRLLEAFALRWGSTSELISSERPCKYMRSNLRMSNLDIRETHSNKGRNSIDVWFQKKSEA